METIIMLVALLVIVGINVFAIVLLNKDSKAKKAIGVICFVPFVSIIIGGCVAMPDAGYVKFWVICCLLIAFASITIAGGLSEE